MHWSSPWLMVLPKSSRAGGIARVSTGPSPNYCPGRGATRPQLGGLLGGRGGRIPQGATGLRVVALLVLLTAVAGGSEASSASQAGPLRVYAGYNSPVYSNKAHWLCRPDLAPSRNICARDLATTAVAADGSLTIHHYLVARKPAFDCFYVYPTVDPGPGANASLEGSHAAEVSVTVTQAAPFGRACRMYVPLYRQVTLAVLAGSAPRQPNSGAIAYG